ncbi:MAG: hypothetical protein RIR00_922 [Pseudomonadota bacterium]|jgi:hypothetical protein
MPIEIRQLSVNMRIIEAPKEKSETRPTAADQAALTRQVLEQCRRMLEKMLQERRER